MSEEKLLDELTPVQEQAIALLLKGSTYSEVASELDIHVNTLYNWRRKKNFQKAMNEAKREVSKAAHSILAANAEKAAQKIASIMDDPDASRTQLAAALKIYDECKSASIEDYEERIERLEELVNARQV